MSASLSHCEFSLHPRDAGLGSAPSPAAHSLCGCWQVYSVSLDLSLISKMRRLKKIGDGLGLHTSSLGPFQYPESI